MQSTSNTDTRRELQVGWNTASSPNFFFFFFFFCVPQLYLKIVQPVEEADCKIYSGAPTVSLTTG